MVAEMETMAPVLLCKLEKIFPPDFFNPMQHMILHLPYEARMGGPVQGRWCYSIEGCQKVLRTKCKNKCKIEASIAEAYILEEVSNFTSKYYAENLPSVHNPPPRWCYSIERCQKVLRTKCKNKCKIEASIAEAYILEEVSNFISKYYADNLPSMHNPPPRYNASEDELSLSIFRGQLGSASGATRKTLNHEEWRSIMLYVLTNLSEVEPYMMQVLNKLVSK